MDLAKLGYRPVSLDATSEGETRIASTWIKPVSGGKWHVAEAQRQANAAVILAKCSSLREIASHFSADADHRETRAHLIDRIGLAQPSCG